MWQNHTKRDKTLYIYIYYIWLLDVIGMFLLGCWYCIERFKVWPYCEQTAYVEPKLFPCSAMLSLYSSAWFAPMLSLCNSHFGPMFDPSWACTLGYVGPIFRSLVPFGKSNVYIDAFDNRFKHFKQPVTLAFSCVLKNWHEFLGIIRLDSIHTFVWAALLHWRAVIRNEKNSRHVVACCEVQK